VAATAQVELLTFQNPKSWGDIEALMKAYDDETWSLFERFGASARQLLFGKEGLNRSEKAELWEISRRACIAFCSVNNPALFPPPSESDMAAAWASVLEGRELQPMPKDELN
jgi:hypothetical protein